jgi:prolyl oligopeptidase
MGTGAGAIPVGSALVRRPDLFAAGVLRSPMTDMVRLEFTPMGPANVFEFGTSTTSAGAAALRAISPLHQVKDEMPYPAVLLTTAMNDPEVEPWQPGKMAARLQAASSSGKPVLLRVDPGTGDNARRAENEELADIYSFVLWQMGDPSFQPPPPTPAAPAASATAPAPAPGPVTQEPAKQ